MIDRHDRISLDHILKEIKNSHTALRESQSENRATFDKLTKKLGYFRSLALSVCVFRQNFELEYTFVSYLISFKQKDYNLDRYRDSNDEENWKKNIVCIIVDESLSIFLYLCVCSSI